MRIYPQINENLFRSDLTSLFKYSKQGIVLKHPIDYINLDSLWEIDNYLVWDILDNLNEKDLSRGQRKDLEEVYEYFMSKT